MCDEQSRFQLTLFFKQRRLVKSIRENEDLKTVPVQTLALKYPLEWKPFPAEVPLPFTLSPEHSVIPWEDRHCNVRDAIQKAR